MTDETCKEEEEKMCRKEKYEGPRCARCKRENHWQRENWQKKPSGQSENWLPARELNNKSQQVER
jgi:hypothetical protein